MRVMLSCPYSLSLFGGVQAQVLGLARALRTQGVDARIIAPCDGPPPEPGITTVGPSTRVPSNGSVAPVAAGRAVARRTMEAIRTFEPDVMHLHEPFSPGANHAALVGTEIPAVGTFHSARSGRNPWYQTLRSPLRPLLRRITSATAVSEQAARQVALTFGTECEIVPNGVEVDRFAKGDSRLSVAPGDLLRGPARAAQGRRRCCSTRSRVSTATPTSGSRATARRLDKLHDARLAVGRVARTHLRRREGHAGSAARRWRASRRSTVSRSASCCSRPWPRAPRWSRPTSTATATSPATTSRRCSSRPATSTRSPTSLRLVLDDDARRDSLIAAGRARADEFSMERLAERFIGIYERTIADHAGLHRAS